MNKTLAKQALKDGEYLFYSSDVIGKNFWQYYAIRYNDKILSIKKKNREIVSCEENK